SLHVSLILPPLPSFPTRRSSDLNQLFSFDLTADGDTIPGDSLGALLPAQKHTDCRAMCVGPDGVIWAAVTVKPTAGGLHLVSRSDRKSTRLNSSHQIISYAVFCL